MEFRGITDDIATQTQAVVDRILKMEIDPEYKMELLADSFAAIGGEFFVQLFNAGSKVFGSEMMATLGMSATDQIQTLAWKLVQDYNLSRPTATTVQDFFESQLGHAMEGAFRNAQSLQKAPTLTRVSVGTTCKWCSVRSGTFTNPDGELFARHAHCNCIIRVSGYGSRNGLVTNYVKGGK